jgi:hypothetical protein
MPRGHPRDNSKRSAGCPPHPAADRAGPLEAPTPAVAAAVRRAAARASDRVRRPRRSIALGWSARAPGGLHVHGRSLRNMVTAEARRRRAPGRCRDVATTHDAQQPGAGRSRRRAGGPRGLGRHRALGAKGRPRERSAGAKPASRCRQIREHRLVERSPSRTSRADLRTGVIRRSRAKRSPIGHHVSGSERHEDDRHSSVFGGSDAGGCSCVGSDPLSREQELALGTTQG